MKTNLGAVLALLLLMLLIGCSATDQKTTTGPAASGAASGAPAGGPGATTLAVQAQTVTEGTLVGKNSTSGTVEAVWQSKVPAQVSGTVSSVLVKAGDWVKAGQVVLQLDTTQLELSLSTAQATLENAQISLNSSATSANQANPKLQYQLASAEASYASAEKTYNATLATFKLGGTSESELDTAKATLDTAKANLEAARSSLATNESSGEDTLAQLRNTVKQAQIAVQQAELNLRNASIRSPYAGQVSSLSYQRGEYVSTSSTAFVLVSAEKKVTFQIPPGDAARLPRGTIIQFTYAAQTWNLTVDTTASAPTSGMVPLSALPSGTLPAYGAVGTISYSVALGTGAQVPVGALQTKNNANYVYTVEDGKVATRTVSILAENGSVAVLSGLTLPAQIITSPPPGLVVGAEVRVVEADAQGGSS